MNLEYNVTYRKKDKGWQYIISYKENGKWKQKAKQGFNLKSEAKTAADKRVLELKKTLSSSKNIINNNYNLITFKQLADEFIEHSKLYKEYNTVRNYNNYAKAFSELNTLKVINIKKGNIQKVVDDLVKKEMSPGTINEYVKRGRLFFNYYIDNYNPDYANPISKITLPKVKHVSSKKALDKKGLDKLLVTLKEDYRTEYYITSLIAGTCGLRCGEILGLTWNDLNEKDKTFHVNKQWKRLGKGIHHFGELKSENSKRIVPIPLVTIKELKKYKANSVTDINNRILPYNESMIISLNKILKKLANISIHELRHTYATLLISNGVDFKTAAKLLGHDVEQTIKTYSHITDDMIKNAKDKLENIF